MSFFKRLFGKKDQSTISETEQTSKKAQLKLKEALEVLKPYKRKTYFPKTKEVEPSFNTKSKIGGLPYLRSKEDWPVCPNCSKHMQLFLQLDLSDLPENKSDGLIQLFYCTNYEPHCESDLEGYLPFSKASVCRKIEVSGDSEIIRPSIVESFGERQITGWKKRDDYPHFEEYEHLGIELELDDELFDLMYDREVGVPLTGDKLFGWPSWVQCKENPSDRKTGTPMELLFQLDSEVNLPYMFGDVGISHLTQSPDNESELGFGWACH